MDEKANEFKAARVTNLDVARDQWQVVLTGLRAIRAVMAAELNVPVGAVSLSVGVAHGHESVGLYVGEKCTSVIDRSLDAETVAMLVPRYRSGVVVDRSEVGE